MVVGGQTWELGGWRRSSNPMPMVSATNFAQIGSYNSSQFNSDTETKKLQKLQNGERITSEGYLTNAPETLDGNMNFVHQIYYWDFSISQRVSVPTTMLTLAVDSKWQNICELPTKYWNVSGGFTPKKLRDGEVIGYLTSKMPECSGFNTMRGNHYWVDKTQQVSLGCGDESATNYSMDSDYIDDSLCTYTCDDINRLVMDNGSCGDCKEGYGLNDDGVCEAGLSTKLSDSMRNLPYGLIGGSIALLVGAKYLLSKRG